MNNTIGQVFRLTIFGESHGEEIGVRIDGIPAGTHIDHHELQGFMESRAPGRDRYSTPRREPDEVLFRAGIEEADGEIYCSGETVEAIIKNTNFRGKDYDELRYVPRPGHADYAAMMKTKIHEVPAGGGPFSGRMTAPLCIAGGIALQMLRDRGIEVEAFVKEIAGETSEVAQLSAIEAASEDGDSVGGLIGCEVRGVPAGIGEPMFGGFENRIAQIVFGIPAIKGIEFGAGFDVARMRGSVNNDAFYLEDGEVKTKTNHAGGILGGMSNGMPITFAVAVKPTPSIAKEQDSVNMETMEPAKLSVRGRHDPCIVRRAVAAVRAAAACAVLDIVLEEER